MARKQKVVRKITDPEVIERLKRNRVVIDEWLDGKIYEMPFESFERIRKSLKGAKISLTPREKFIKELANSYRNNFGQWPNIFRY